MLTFGNPDQFNLSSCVYIYEPSAQLIAKHCKVFSWSNEVILIYISYRGENNILFMLQSGVM